MIYFLTLNILLLIVLITILISILIRSYIWARLCGEIYSGLGIALIASTLVAYNFSIKMMTFLFFMIGGIVSLIIGILMVLFSESILINAAEE